MKKILIVALLSFATVSQAQSLAAKYACSDFWGRKLPVEERTKENCAELLTAEDYVAIGRNGGAGPSGVAANATATIPAGTYYTPTGSYQVSHSGSSTFIARASRR